MRDPPSEAPSEGAASRCRRAAPAALAAALWLATGCTPLVSALLGREGEVHGRALFASGALAPAHAVAYLERLDREPGPAGGESELRLRAERFDPPLLIAPLGATLRVHNEDEIYHRVFSYSPAVRFDLGVLRSGESGRVELSAPGELRVRCALHPAESAVVLVARSRWWAEVDARGGFAIRGVPPGRYALHVWSEGASAEVSEVVVRAGEQTWQRATLAAARGAE